MKLVRPTGRLKMRDKNYRHHQKCRGGKCGTGIIGTILQRVENAGPSSYGKPKLLIHFGIKYASRSWSSFQILWWVRWVREGNSSSPSYEVGYHVMAGLQFCNSFSQQSTTPKEACFVVIVTTVADDSFYTFHRRHASPQLRRVRLLAVNIVCTVDDDDDDGDNNHNKSSLSHSGRATSPSLMAENGLARCVCYYLCNAYYRQVQSLSRRYATSTPQCHMLPIHYTALFIPQKQRKSPLPVGATRPTGKKSSSSPPSRPHHTAYIPEIIAIRVLVGGCEP